MKYDFDKNKSLEAFTKEQSKLILGERYVTSLSLDIEEIISSGGKFQFRYGQEVDINNPKFKWLKEKVTRKGIDYTKARIVVTKMIINGESVFLVFDGHHRLHIFKELGCKKIVVDVVDLTGITKEEEVILQGLLNEPDGKLGNSFKDILKNLHKVISEDFNPVLFEEDKDYKKGEIRRITQMIVKWKGIFTWYEAPAITLKQLLPMLFDGVGQHIIRPTVKDKGENSWYHVCIGKSDFFPEFYIPGEYGKDYHVVTNGNRAKDILSTIDRHNVDNGFPVSRRIYLAPDKFSLNIADAWDNRELLLEEWEKVLKLHIDKQIQYDLGNGVTEDVLIRRRKKYYEMDGFLPMVVGEEDKVMDSNRVEYEYY